MCGVSPVAYSFASHKSISLQQVPLPSMFPCPLLAGSQEGGRTHDAVDERQNVTLRITVSSPIRSASRIQLASTASLGHFSHVQSAVHAAREFGGIDIKRDFIPSQLQQLVLQSILLKKIGSWRYGAPIHYLMHRDTGAGSFDPVLGIVGDAFDDAILGACSCVGTNGDIGGTSPLSAIETWVMELMDGMS